MQAVVVDGRGGVQLVERPIPEIGPRDVLVAVRATGICGTDLHLIAGTYEHGRYPVVPGHEFAGIVARTGKDVTRAQPGDLVGVDPNIGCNRCRWCTGGAKNLCADLKPVGVAVDGSCAEYVAVPEEVVHRLPAGLDEASGALVEPLSCVLHAVQRTPGGWGAGRVAVLGAGSIGLLAIAVAKHLGSGQITVFEPRRLRRELALQMGAHAAFADAGERDDDAGFDIAVEASGHPEAIQSAVAMLGRRGRLVQMGVAHDDVRISVSPYAVFAKELSIIGSNSLANAYPAATDLMADMAEALRPLVTDRLPLSQYAEAVRRASSPHSIKVQVVPG